MSTGVRPKECPVCMSTRILALARVGGGWGCEACGTLFAIERGPVIVRTRPGSLEAVGLAPAVPAGDGWTLNEMRDQVLALQATVRRLEQDRDLHREQLVAMDVRLSEMRLSGSAPVREDGVVVSSLDQMARLFERAGLTKVVITHDVEWQITATCVVPGAPDFTILHSGPSLGQTMLLVVSSGVRTLRRGK